MPATFINMLLILLGGAAGLLFKNLISSRLMSILTHALGLCVLVIGIGSAIGTQNMLCVIVCMVIGTVIGNAIDIERRLEGAGDFLRARVIKDDSGRKYPLRHRQAGQEDQGPPRQRQPLHRGLFQRRPAVLRGRYGDHRVHRGGAEP